MTPDDAAAESAQAIRDVASHFMLDPATYALGAELGFPGMSFYMAGRGGALGDVAGDVVAAAFVFFEPATVVEGWEAGRSAMGRHEAGEQFVGCGYRWAESRVPDDEDSSRLAELAGRLVNAASPAAAPLFAAWRAMPEPADVPALVLHRMNLLRELRGAYHGGAVLGAGLAPQQAVALRTPHMAPLFGWPDSPEDLSALAPRLDQADEATDRAMGVVFEALDAQEREQFVELAEALRNRISS